MSILTIINLISCLLIVFGVGIVISKTPKGASVFYIIQSLFLILLFVLLGSALGATEFYMWALVSFITKVVLVPLIMYIAWKKTSDLAQDVKPSIGPVGVIAITAIEIIVCFAVVQGVKLPAAIMYKSALAMSLGMFLLGLTCIITQRNLIKQIFGYLLMETGAHLMLAALAPSAAEAVEIAIGTDSVLTVLVMCVFAVRICKHCKTLDSDDLQESFG